MSRGCNVLRDIAEVLNAKADELALNSDESERDGEHCESYSQEHKHLGLAQTPIMD